MGFKCHSFFTPYDTNKYERVYSERLAHKGHLREYNHTYGYCLYDKEKLKKSRGTRRIE